MQNEQNPLVGEESSAAEGDGDRGRYSLLVRCASQSSLDECSQRAEPGARAQHAARLLDALARLRTDAALCDVRLRACAEGCEDAGGGEGSGEGAAGEGVWAHRAVLAASSPYFRAMFTQFDERTQHTVTIKNVEPEALQAIVDYIYNPDSLVITEDNVQGILSGASLLAVGGARAACCAWLAAALAPDNALGVRAFAELHACHDLAAAAKRFLDHHFLQVLESDEFLALQPDALAALIDSDRITVLESDEFLALQPDALAALIDSDRITVLESDEFLALQPDALAALIDSDRITVPSEEVILDAVIRWMQHDPEERRGALGRLLAFVRLPLLAREALVARAAAEPLLSAPVAVKDLVIEALSLHLLRGERRAAAAAGCPRARPRRPPRPPRALLVVGGQAPKAVREAEAYVLDAARWRPAAPLPSRRCRAGLAVRDHQVLAVGGFNGTLRVRSVDVYNVAADAWSAGPPLAARRSTLGVAVIDRVVYAVGGFDGTSGLSSAEALAPGATEWRPLASMRARRSSVGVAALGGRLYAVGGYDGAARQCLQSVERYDPATDTWEPVADMSVRRSGAGVGVVGGALYAVGGHDGPAVRRSCERWRPDSGWAPVPPMQHARRNAGVVALDDKLYVVGGDDGAANLASVEVFDPASESWSLLPAPMALGRSYAGVCVVELA